MYKKFFAASKAGNDKLFVHINTTTFFVNFIPNQYLLDEFTAWYSVYYYFTIRPSALNQSSSSGWTGGGANEST